MAVNATNIWFKLIALFFVVLMIFIFIKHNSYANKALIISILYILSYQIKAIRKCIYYVLVYVGRFIEMIIPIDLKADVVLAIYHNIELFCLLIISSVCIWYLIVFFHRFYNHAKRKKFRAQNNFEATVIKYLNDPNQACLLIKGAWGSGKTYKVNEFLTRYYKNTFTKVYRVSCFGLTTRTDVINEVNAVIKKEDSSLKKEIINVLEILPVVGGFLRKTFENDYSIESINHNSVFVFDDFERITMANIDEIYTAEDLYSKGYPSHYKRNVWNDSPTLADASNEYNQEEFDKISDAFYRAQFLTKARTFADEMSKYTATVGLINEIIETYKIPVIIICNDNEMPKTFFYQVFVEKLNCITYTVKPEANAVESIGKHILDLSRLNVKDPYYKAFMENYMLCCQIPLGLSVQENPNLRFYAHILHSYFEEICNMPKEIVEDQSFMRSLICSIYLVHSNYYYGKLRFLNFIANGQSIGFVLKLLHEQQKLVDFFTLNKLRWIDIRLSGKWFYHYSNVNIQAIYAEFKSYKYKELENEALNNKMPSEITTLPFAHYLYLQEICPEDFDKSIKRRELKLATVKDTYGNLDRVESLLQAIDYVRIGRDFSLIFEQIQKEYSDPEIDDSNLRERFYRWRHNN